MINHIIIHGRLTATPELKQTQSNVAVTTFSVAVDRQYARQGEEKLTDFFSVVAWHSLAETICKYCSKGKEIIISGEMQSRKYTDKDGNARIAWEILANSIDFCGSKSDNAPQPTPIASVPVEDDNVPF